MFGTLVLASVLTIPPTVPSDKSVGIGITRADIPAETPRELGDLIQKTFSEEQPDVNEATPESRGDGWPGRPGRAVPAAPLLAAKPGPRR